MGEMIQVETNFNEISLALRKIAPLAHKKMWRAMNEVAKEVANETRGKLPSGMTRARYGIKSQMRAYGATVVAGIGGPPKSWAGAYTGNRRKKSFKHPVHAAVGSARYDDKSSWPVQSTNPILQNTFETRRTMVVLKCEEAIDIAIREAGLQGDL